MFKDLHGLSTIVADYDAFLFDLWGVIHDGCQPYPYVKQSLEALAAANKPVIFISNVPRPRALTAQQLRDMGLGVADEQVITSGELVREQLVHRSDDVFKNMGPKFYYLSSPKNVYLVEDLNVARVYDIAEADYLLISLYTIQGEDDPAAYDAILEQGVKRNLPMVCANPDKIGMSGPTKNLCAGFFADKYQAMGGTVYHYGKPYEPIYRKAQSVLRDQGVDAKRIVVFGDTLHTDIAGGVKHGFDSVLLLTGIYSHLLTPPSGYQVAGLQELCQREGLTPTYVACDMRWV